MKETYKKNIEEWLCDNDMYLSHKVAMVRGSEVGIMVNIHHRDTEEAFLESFDKMDTGTIELNTYDKVVEMICENLLLNKKTILEYKNQCNISF